MILTASLASGMYFFRHVIRQNTLTQSRRNISRHYDVVRISMKIQFRGRGFLNKDSQQYCIGELTGQWVLCYVLGWDNDVFHCYIQGQGKLHDINNDVYVVINYIIHVRLCACFFCFLQNFAKHMLKDVVKHLEEFSSFQ